MKNKKLLKIITIFISIFYIFSVFSFIQASSIGDITSGADDFISTGDANKNQPISDGELKGLTDSLYNILLIIGVVVAAIVGIILGIQFITGSVEQKSKIKESLMPYIVGCVVIFGAFGIWKLAIIILRNI